MRYFNNGTGPIHRHAGRRATTGLLGRGRPRPRKAEHRRARSSPFCLEVLEDRIELSTILVNTLADNPNGPIPSSTTLRDAINRADAGSDTQYTIDLTGLSGTITLGSALPDLGNTNGGVSGKEIDILGPGMAKVKVARSSAGGTPDFRIFTIDAGVNAKLIGLTIERGDVYGYNASGYGGGVRNDGTLTVSGSILDNNSASLGGGIFNDGILTVSDSTISDNYTSAPASTHGGGICNEGGDVKLVSCTIVGNLATYGGGIFNGIKQTSPSTLTVTSSVIKGNTAEYTGGGIMSGYDGSGSQTVVVSSCTIEDNHALSFEGGGISNANTMIVNSCTIDGNSAERGGGISSGGTLTVTDSTINSNQAYGRGSGGFYNLGTATIANSTLAFNSASNFGGVRNDGTLKFINDTIVDNTDSTGGGGLDTSGTATLNNTIIALNLRGTSASDISGAVSSSSAYNLIGTGGPGGLSNSNGNQVGVSVAQVGLASALANNGGPTQTIALLPGSSAIDAGSNALAVDPSTGQPSTTDQRGTGFVRIVHGTVDIGAYEFDSGTFLAVTAQPPSSVAVGASFGLTVTAKESSGNVDSSFNGTVTVALSNNPGGAALGGTLSVTAQNGVATFSALALDKAGTGYTLLVSANGLNGVTTNAFDVTPAAAMVLPPTLVGMQSLVNPQSPTKLVLTFSQPMGVARAEDPANYRLVSAGRDHRLGTKDDRVIPIRWARYDAASWSVKLRLAHPQPPDRTLWLTVTGASPGGLTNASGTPLAGAGTVGPGGEGALRLDLESLQTPMRLGLLPGGGFETRKALGRNKARTLSAGGRPLGSWQIAAGSVDVQRYWPAAERRQTLDLNGVSPGTIEQSFATVPGQVYQLLFDYSNNPDARGRTATATVTVTGAGPLLSEVIAHASSTPRHMKYARFLGTFAADSATTTLRFTSTTPGVYGVVLDAVSVMAVPGVSDTTPPVIQLTTAPLAGPVSQNVTFAGRVTDDGTGVARLDVQVDSGPFQPVALDALGQFTFTTALATDGTADGVHVVRFRATDRAGNASPVTTESFALFTQTELFNGGFETPSVSGSASGASTFSAGDPSLSPWEIVSGSIDVVDSRIWPAFQGAQSIDLDGVSAGTIQQSFVTSPGQTYQLSFYYANNSDNPTQTDTATVSVTGDGTLLSQGITHVGSTPSNMDYSHFLGTFVADSATATLQFASTTPGVYGVVLDGVSVRAVPGSVDTTPPVIQLTTAAPIGPVSQNVTFVGRATDEGTGVARLDVQVDSGPFQPVALSSLGQFNFTTALAIDGTADGAHVVRFRATDRAGNVSPVTTETFMLFTQTELFNGGFETPSVSGSPTGSVTFSAGGRSLAPWVIDSGSIDVVDSRYWPAFQGTQSIDLSGVSRATIQQSFHTAPGQSYMLTFYYANNADAPSLTTTATVSIFDEGHKTLLSQTIGHTGSSPINMNYTPFAERFVADSTTTTLQFTSTGPDDVHGIALDAVLVGPVPGTVATTGH